MKKYPLAVALTFALVACSDSPAQAEPGPWHVNIISTSFWVGQVINADIDGSQKVSAYDENWEANYGGCDGIVAPDGTCQFEVRTADNGFFPKHMTPLQNPFYLDLPLKDPKLQHRWVELRRDGNVCFGQIEDAGPAVYDDTAYVYGTARPKSTRFYGAGMDVSPALHACLSFDGGVFGASDQVSWRFVDSPPEGPWTRVITR